MAQNRVFIIGLDGASPYLFSWAKESKLKNFRKIMEKGVHGKLRSTIPPNTYPAWASFATGKNPGKHGAFGYTKLAKDPYIRGRILLDIFDAFEENAFWKLIAQMGKKIGIYNLPMSYPPFKVKGFIIPSWIGAPPGRHKKTYPPNLRSKLEEIDEKYPIPHFHVKMDDDEKIDYLNKNLTKEIAKNELLLENYRDLDLFITYLNDTDKVQHFFWKYMDTLHPEHSKGGYEKYGEVILNYFRRIDEEFLSLFLKERKSNIFIVSDHGFGRVHRRFNTNIWLNKMGLLYTKNKKSEPLLKKAGLTREFLGQLLNKGHLQYLLYHAPKNLKKRIPSENSLEDQIDWNKTKAYSVTRGYGEGYIYLNTKTSEYGKMIDYIIQELKKIKDPKTGNKVIEKVYRKKEIYNGKYSNNAPDIVFLTRHLEYIVSPSLAEGTIFSNGGKIRSGSHRISGILMATGPELKEGFKIDGARITDIAPTVLHMFGVSIPKDMDGKVLTEIFDQNSEVVRRIIKYQDESEKNKIRQTIKKLRASKKI
jgi:predicted AlkP superfamily phosphohydrolase/phosphomutase